jgi:hypothetical protein
MIRKLAVYIVTALLASGAGVLSSQALPVAPAASSSDHSSSIELVAKRVIKKKGRDGGHRYVKSRGRGHNIHFNVRVKRGHWHGHRYRNRHGAYIYFYNGYYYPTPWWTLGYSGYGY